MTHIKVLKEKNQIVLIEVKGHSGYASKGEDIVCASTSSIVTTTINALLRIDENSIEYEVKDGYIFIKILKHDHYIDILLENMISLLKELEMKYQKNIKLNI